MRRTAYIVGAVAWSLYNDGGHPDYARAAEFALANLCQSAEA